MDIARNLHTDELVEAEELWELDVVDKDAYACRGCAAKVFPASYDKQRNKRRPYFSIGKLNKHMPGCDVDGEEKIVGRARKERVGSKDGFPMPFPSKLTLSQDRPAVREEGAQPYAMSGVRSAGQGSAPSHARKLHHGHTVKTIRPACRTFINFPNDRAFLPLEIPGAPGNTYARLFWFLPNKKPELFKQPRHLYYAPIRWKAEPVESESHCELTLNAGEWDTVNKRYNSLCVVRIDWSRWSPARRDALLRECGAARAEAIEEAKTDSQIKGWVFFVGTQDAKDPALFHVDDHRFICCLAAKLTWPVRDVPRVGGADTVPIFA